VRCVDGGDLILFGGEVVYMDGEDDEAGQGRCGRERQHPAREPSVARGGWVWMDGWFERERLGEVDDSAAVGAGGEMGERGLLLVERQGVLSEGVELVRVRMLAGLKVCRHLASCCWCARVVLSENEEVCEVCSSVRRFISRSRGSAPSASSAARLLRPPDWRLRKSCLRRSAVRRLSLRLMVASWTWRRCAIWSSVFRSRK